MQTRSLAMLCLLSLSGLAAMAAEPTESEPLVSLELRDVELQAALQALSSQSGRRFLLTDGVDAAVAGPDITMSGVPLSMAIEMLSLAYGVCSVQRPGIISFEDCDRVGPVSPGKVRLGVSLVSVTPETVYERGGIVANVLPDSVAARAGIQRDDRIIGFNGRAIYRASQLVDAVSQVEPGTEVGIEIVRGNQRARLTAQF